MGCPGFTCLLARFVAAQFKTLRDYARTLSVLAVSLATFLPGRLASQVIPQIAGQKPTPAEAQRLLQTRPDLVAQLRARISASGLTPAQVRARLRAEGYPENLLDPYLNAGVGTDSLPGSNVFDAVRALGLVDSLALDTIRTQVGLARAQQVASRPRATPTPGADTAAIDSAAFKIFGIDLFKSGTTQFEPNLAGPVDATYRLGPGDQLVLILTGDVEAAHSLDVTREGFVVIPQVGQLNVANLTLGQVEDLLYTRLGRVYSGVRRGNDASTRFSLSVARLRTNQVFVLGDVAAPGNYRVSSAGTALTALYAASGPTENGSMRAIQVKRAGKVVATLDLYEYLLAGNSANDVRLENGDVVFVPVHGPRVQVTGEVIRPATYELKPGESFGDLLRSSGGFTATADRRRIQIQRILPPEQRTAAGRDRTVLDISSDQLVTGGSAIALQPNDVIRVFPVADHVRNRVTIAGSVWAAGSIGYAKGMTLSEAVRRAGGLRADAYLGRVVVTRIRPDSSRMVLESAFRDSTGAAMPDVDLREDDEIRVFSVSDFRKVRYVSISGAVRKSGRYPYAEGMTLRQLVLAAGGLDEAAYLDEAEVARLPENRGGGVTALTLRVPLDSTYVLDRDANARWLNRGQDSESGLAPEVQLKPYDNVLILRQPEWQLERTVAITGEVRFPGKYALRNKLERITDVLDRAGRMTSEADADGVALYRKQNGIGRIGVDLASVLKNPKARDNLVLQDGDSIVIPTYVGVVDVRGAVNSPVAVAYVPGADLSYYVSAAGGLSRLADSKRAYVTQPNGKVESRSRKLGFTNTPKPRAGAVVFVPNRDPNDKRDFVGAMTSTAQVLASLVAIVVVLRR